MIGRLAALSAAFDAKESLSIGARFEEFVAISTARHRGRRRSPRIFHRPEMMWRPLARKELPQHRTPRKLRSRASTEVAPAAENC